MVWTNPNLNTFRQINSLPHTYLSPAEEAGRDQPSFIRHVELCHPLVGAGDQRGSLRRPVQYGNWHEGWLTPFATPPFTFKACWNFFSVALYTLPVCSSRLPWKAWGPPSHREYRHIFASLWKYAWTKTRRRGPSLIWLCQFWKKCRTNRNLNTSVSLLYWTRYDKWWCGAYQYCLKILLCCCIQGHCSFSFWEKFSSSHIFYIFYFLMWCQILIYVFVSLIRRLKPGTTRISTIFSFLDWITCGCQHRQLALLYQISGCICSPVIPAW